MQLVINDKHAVCAQRGTMRRKPGQTTWAASGEHAEKGCKWLEQMTPQYRGECPTCDGPVVAAIGVEDHAGRRVADLSGIVVRFHRFAALPRRPVWRISRAIHLRP